MKCRSLFVGVINQGKMGYQTFIGIQESENMKKIFKSTFKYSKLKKLQYPVELYSSGLYLNVKKVEAR
jgi:hypothetical protein